MRQVLLLLTITLLIACSGDTGQDKKSLDVNNKLKKFDTVKEMLLAAGNYKEEEGRLKFLSDSNESLHVQVSQWVNENTDSAHIAKGVKTNIVYVAYQAFARTSINEITITSVPMSHEQNSYLEEYKITETVKRETAEKIIKNRFGFSSCEQIYGIELDGQFFVEGPNIYFNQLQYSKLEIVFPELINQKETIADKQVENQ